MAEAPQSVFLLEVRSEEIPARMLASAIEELGASLLSELVAVGVVPQSLRTAFTPRRLIVLIEGLPRQTPDRTRIELGPPAVVAFDADGKPTSAALGFARKFSVSVEDLRREWVDREGRTVPAGTAGAQERAVLARVVPGTPLKDLFAEKVPTLLRQLSWPKTMRWGIAQGPWVRPVHSIVALFDSEVVPFELFGVRSGRVTAGHPILSPHPIELNSAGEYEAKLKELGLVIDPRERSEQLLQTLRSSAAQHGGELIEDPKLLERLVAVCEIPGVVAGRFEERFLGLPEEILQTSLRDHQSAFSIRDPDGPMLPVFLTVMDRAEDPCGWVQKGNEWVVAARLEDAFFFWHKDREQPLQSFAPRLEGLAVHAELGSYREKTERLVRLVRELACGQLPPELVALAERSAAFAKLDLVTGMVGEFPDLQGIVGGLYLREQGEPYEVWSAVYDQYRPASTDDELPRSETGRVLALADRLDHLIGFFSLGESYYPTGSRDPFALRRAALGAVRLASSGTGPDDLTPIVRAAVEEAALRLARDSAEKTFATLVAFLRERLSFLLEHEGLPVAAIHAALGARAPELALRPFALRAQALAEMLGDPDLASVAQLFRRVKNILKGVDNHLSFHPERCQLPAEVALFEAYQSIESNLDIGVEDGRIGPALRAAASLASVLDRFFIEVLVMDPDFELRQNRLGLLDLLRNRLLRLADLSYIGS